jgi:phage terminase large subunit-like protein
MIEVGQTVKNLSDPMKELEAMVVEGRFHHDGNPVFKWMVANVVAHVDAKDNIFPRKERPEYKIDGVVATIMALSRLVLGGGGEENAFYAEVWD